MSRFQTLPAVTLSLLLILIIAGLYSTARSAAAQTVPTRTPTPEPGGGDPPTATPDNGGDDGEPGPAPTSTDRPQATATSTTVAPVATPEGGVLPTAEACGMEPTVQAHIGNVNVRNGPGLDYEVVAQLQLLEVRPIVGRARYATWWQISLDDGEVGWVEDEVVTVSGYTGLAPTVVAPELPDGNTPTPGSPWAPTPRPDCTPPTATATASATPTATSEDADGPQSSAPSGGSGEGATSTATATPTATETATATATGTDEARVAASTETPVPLPAEANTEGGSTIPWLPIVGIGLILAAGALFMVRRGTTASESG